MNEYILKAVEVLRKGGTVAFATETVYGLGANAADPTAVEKIFRVKGRPIGHPLIVHIAEISQLSDWAAEVPVAAWQLAEACWPGPLTLILPKAKHVSNLVTGGQATVGIRIPSHPQAQALLRAFGGGIAAPSANRFGRISPTTAVAVYAELGNAVDIILEGGQCEVGLESTIVDMTSAQPVVLRPGAISAAQMSEILKMDFATHPQQNSPRVSGSLKSHYAPETPALWVNSIADFLASLTYEDLPCVVLATSLHLPLPAGVDCKKMPEMPREYAYQFYATLRELDSKRYRKIIIEAVPKKPEWEAVADRMRRAAEEWIRLTV